MSYPEFVFGGEVYYATSDHCGYCDGKKDPMEKRFSLQSFRDEYLKKQSDPSYNTKYEILPKSVTMGCHVYYFTPSCYEDIMSRGFRRSGTFLYRPDQLRNCCRMYTIRTRLSWLKPTKEHRHTVNRFMKHILGNDKDTGNDKKKSQPFNLSDLIRFELDTPKSKFHTRIEPAKATEEKFQLYKKYQMTVHKDKASDLSMKGFKRFLCEDPFDGEALGMTDNITPDFEKMNSWRAEKLKSGDPSIFGAVHECYYINEKLIAIAVLDILPNSISSVYFIWDPDYAHLGLGTLSALREMLLTEQLGKEFYYMGYYIADCVKMKYKAKFSGEVLDISTEKYIRLDSLNGIIDDGGLIVSSPSSTPDAKIEHQITGALHGSLDTSVINAAEEIYGMNGGAYENAKEHASKIVTKDKFLKKLQTPSDDKVWMSRTSQMFELPLVSPGLIPIWQIDDILSSNRINTLFKGLRCYNSFGALSPFKYTKGNDPRKYQIIKYLRLFGEAHFEKPGVILM
ncbi:hypothetical protein CANARDRAFT_5808 [[Candida] arabinofermentans NRRL YB-2248]|uniref:arginyltransferase n=1 Tax=[Candida] arabinofermentans NRRL YB-2248 TaxID=983967 RepID=A0A1E4T6G0_9ASCO|nr:hypothetical protein CANARDRAFT_5808 [[Candida] arabinofermentans NRRL YB-2248]